MRTIILVIILYAPCILTGCGSSDQSDVTSSTLGVSREIEAITRSAWAEPRAMVSRGEVEEAVDLSAVGAFGDVYFVVPPSGGGARAADFAAAACESESKLWGAQELSESAHLDSLLTDLSSRRQRMEEPPSAQRERAERTAQITNWETGLSFLERLVAQGYLREDETIRAEKQRLMENLGSLPSDVVIISETAKDDRASQGGAEPPSELELRSQRRALQMKEILFWESAQSELLETGYIRWSFEKENEAVEEIKERLAADRSRSLRGTR